MLLKTTITRIIIIVLFTVLLAKLNGYPQVNDVWSLTELADHISNRNITAITVYDVGVTAVTKSDRIAFVVTLAKDIDSLSNKLSQAGVNTKAIQSLEIRYLRGLRLRFDGRILLPIVAYVLITIYQRRDSLV